MGSADDSLVERRPDLLLLDLCMPVMGGWTLLRSCRQDPRLVHLPVVFMTAALEASRAQELGVAFVAKPFDLHTLLGTIRDTLLLSHPSGVHPQLQPERRRTQSAVQL
jgi:CheY-like chemotaxis protein